MLSLQNLPTAAKTSRINAAVARLDAWFETMRGPAGYGGPVAHWWQQSLIYTGPGLDWRYEGIIAGYINLWQRTGDECWLAKACRAGDDLISGQLANGHYPASAFEINPATGGTPHEAACDLALLLLAQAVRHVGRNGWEPYAAGAERNLERFYIDHLWDDETQSFKDSLRQPFFVPNKAATACEAFFLHAEITGSDDWVERYALPTLVRITDHQVRGRGRLDGAIAQNSLGGRMLEKYFPIYIARCIPALLRGYQWTNHERYADCAQKAMQFIVRWLNTDSSLPTVVYSNQSTNRYPNWIAPLGDVLRAADELDAFGIKFDLSTMLERLLSGQDSSGGIQTASGFAAQAGGSSPKLPDVRDVLHVAGWCDKAFRYLSSYAGPGLPDAISAYFESTCKFRGRMMELVETPTIVEISCQGRICYRWRKGESWPEIARPDFWLR